MKDFNDYSAFGALDIILKIIYEVDTTMWGMSIEEIHNKLVDIESTHFAPQEIQLLLNQLEIDGNIEYNQNGRIKLSLAGRFLHLKRGYAEQEILRVADEEHLKLLSNQQAQQGKSLVHLNWMLVICASIASIYYAIEIVKTIRDNWSYIVDFFCRC
jgi:hypothetical protein